MLLDLLYTGLGPLLLYRWYGVKGAYFMREYVQNPGYEVPTIKVRCLKCDCEFDSTNKKRNRVCFTCNRQNTELRGLIYKTFNNGQMG